MDQVSRVGQKGDLIQYDHNGERSIVAWVEVLDDRAAAVWTVRDTETGRDFKVSPSTIRFYN